MWYVCMAEMSVNLVQRQTAITAYLKSTQLLLFSFARQTSPGELSLLAPDFRVPIPNSRGAFICSVNRDASAQ